MPLEPEPRRRHAGATDDLDSRPPPGGQINHAFVGQVASFGGTPGNDLFHMVRTAAVSGDECSGCPGTVAPDLEADVRVLVLGKNRPVGSSLIAHHIGGLWVARPLSGKGVGAAPCTFTVTVLSAEDLTPVNGVTITIAGASGVLCSGSTGSDGVFTCGVAAGVTPTITATKGDCAYAGPINCNNPLVLYLCVGSVDYKAVDDGGGTIGGIPFFAQPFGYSTVVSMTDGAPTGVFGQWRSFTAGTAVFCWFGPQRPANLNFSYPCEADATRRQVGVISAGYLGPKANLGYNTGNETYWERCAACRFVHCGEDNREYVVTFFRKSLWLAGSCCGSTCVSAGNAIPKTLHATINGPSAVLAGDSGVSIPIDWDPTSWDGDDETAVTTGPFGSVPNRMIFSTGCLGPNGAGGYCYSRAIVGPGGCLQETQHTFTAYKSHRIILVLQPAFRMVGPFPDIPYCNASLSYQNFWNDDCPANDPAPCACPGAGNGFDSPRCLPPSTGRAQLPRYCFITAGPVPCTTFYYGSIYPKSLGFNLINASGPPVADLRLRSCAPVNWVDDVFTSWKSTCVGSYDGTVGQGSSATVTA